MSFNIPADATKIEEAARDALLKLGVDVQGQITKPFTEWALEVAPKIAHYASLAYQGSAEAEKNLQILRTIAVAKAAKFTIIGHRLTEERLGDIAIFAARLIASLIV